MLRVPRRKSIAAVPARKFLLYVSRTCQRHREDAFDALSLLGTAWSGGKCEGSAGDVPHLAIVGRDWESSVSSYHDFRFALVMENTKTAGYITEKILIAFVSNSIPIYYGTEEVFQIFNQDAFVFYHVEDPEPALSQIEYLEANRTAYSEMLAAPIYRDGVHTLEEYFSLHDSVAGGRLKGQIREMMGVY